MTGGTEWRSARAKFWTEQFSGRKSSVIEGKIDLGNVPPPIFDVPLPIGIFHRQSLETSHDRGRAGAQLVFRDLQKRERRNFARHLVEVKIDSRLQRGENQLVAAQGTKERFAFERRNQSFFSDDDSGLWSSE